MIEKEQLWRIGSHDHADKRFELLPPLGWDIELFVDYDDVDHEKVDAEAARIVNILNANLITKTPTKCAFCGWEGPFPND